MLWRPFLRGVLTGLLVLSLIWSGWTWAQVARSPVGSLFVARGEAEISAAYERALARHATPKALGARISARLEESPRNWVALEGLMALVDAQGLDLPEPVVRAYTVAHAQDHSFAARAQSCAACAYDLRACTMGADLACGLSVNLTVAGDILSLSRESGAYLRGAPVDQLDVTLSFIGIGATGLAAMTGGSSYTLKLGAGLMKTAHRMGRLSPGFGRVYARAAREGIDWARVPAVRNGDDLARLARAPALRPALELTEALGTVQARTGMRGALHLVGYVDDVSDARRMAQATRALGPRSVGAFELLGKSRFLRTGLRLSQIVLEALAVLVAALLAALALVANMLLRAMRRAVVRA